MRSRKQKNNRKRDLVALQSPKPSHAPLGNHRAQAALGGGVEGGPHRYPKAAPRAARLLRLRPNGKRKRKGNFKQLPPNECFKYGQNIFLQEMDFYFHIFPRKAHHSINFLLNLCVCPNFRGRDGVKEKKRAMLGQNWPRNLATRTPYRRRSILGELTFCNFNI